MTSTKRPAKAFSVDHFRRYAELMVWDDDEHREPEDWQLEMVGDLFSGFKRNLWIVPEENGKSTLVALIALYGADFTSEPGEAPSCRAAYRRDGPSPLGFIALPELATRQHSRVCAGGSIEERRSLATRPRSSA